MAMVILPFVSGIGRADLLFLLKRSALQALGLEGQTSLLEDMLLLPPQLSIEERKKMTMVITLSFLGLEGQTSSSLEDTA